MFRLSHTKHWDKMTREERKLAGLQVQTQLSAISHTIAFDLTMEFARLGIPAEVTCGATVNWRPGMNPNHDA